MSTLFWIALIILVIYLFQRAYFNRADKARPTSPAPHQAPNTALPSTQTNKTVSATATPATTSVSEAKVTPAVIPDAEPVGPDFQHKSVNGKDADVTEPAVESVKDETKPQTKDKSATKAVSIAAADKKITDETPKEPAEHDPSPKRLKAPRGGKADKLIAITGIGNILQGKLFDLGIYHFDQLASLTPEQAEWVNRQIGFTGRIEREDWINQAAKLAANPPQPAKKSKASSTSTKAKTAATKTAATKAKPKPKKKPAAPKKAATTEKS